AEKLKRLESSPSRSPSRSPSQSPARSPRQQPRASATAGPASAQHSRFARKEPRAQDLREYDGAAGDKLDEWLAELRRTARLYRLSGEEAVEFAVSRLRGPADAWWAALDA